MAVINENGEAEYVEGASELVETAAVEETVSVAENPAEPEDDFAAIMGG